MSADGFGVFGAAVLALAAAPILIGALPSQEPYMVP